jgi:YspA, cpYpsA-related SLOG family
LKPFRIVVTGSRYWQDEQTIGMKLQRAVLQAYPFTDVVVVQGGAEGADGIARAWAERFRVKVETFEADWKTHGKAAGPLRNTRMLDAGAHLVLAFPVGDPSSSPGTWDTIHKAAVRGIPTSICPAPKREVTP